MAKLFSRITQEAIRKGKKLGDQQTRDWFRDRAQQVVKANPKAMMLRGETAAKMTPGEMYMYFYDPKYKDTLPYYDTFPILFPFDVSPPHFMGLNMHYLPPLLRARLMDALYDLTDKTVTEDSKLNLSYQILKGASRFEYFKPTVHKYRFDHVRSNFVRIPPDQWEIALFMPTERFRKSTKRQVWSASRDKI